MISTQYIKLNMVPSGVLPILYCSQYDIGRPLGMTVYNGGEAVDLDGYTCTVEATRTDGTAITAAVTTSDSIGVFTTTAVMTNQADRYPVKLVLFDSQSHRVASLAFIMVVTPKTMDENAESIEEDASLYQQYTGTVQTLIADIRLQLTDLKNEKVQKCNTCIDMRASTALESGMFCQTGGYRYIDDGGAALYYIMGSAPVEGHYEILQDGLIAVLIHNDVGIPEQFGAYGDGVHDDYSAIMQCLHDVGNCVLTKTYGVATTINMPNGTSIYGGGRGSGTLKWIGGASNALVIAIPYTSYFCSVHDITIDGNETASGIYDCFGKTPGTFVGIRSQIYNLDVTRYTEYGIYLDGMGSEISNCYVTGNYNYSKIGMYVASTDNRIMFCRLQLNNQYGLYSIASSNVFVGVKCSVNYKGAFVRGGFLVAEIECQENRSTGMELGPVALSTLDLNINCNSYAEANGYGLIMTSVKQCNITVVGRKHSVLGSSTVGQEKALIKLDDNSRFNNLDAAFTSETSNDYMYFDGISVANHITLNGSEYDNHGIMTAQGYKILNRRGTLTSLVSADIISYNGALDKVVVSINNNSGALNMFSVNIPDLSTRYSKVIVIVESESGDFENYSADSGFLRLNYPVLITGAESAINPTKTINAKNYCYIISTFETLTDAIKIYFRTSVSNNCDNLINGIKFKIFGLEK